MDNKKTSITGNDVNKTVQHEKIIADKNSCILELWNDFVETNKKWYQLNWEELKISSILEAGHHKMVPFLQM